MKGLRSGTGKTSPGGELWSRVLTFLYRAPSGEDGDLGLPKASSLLREEGEWVVLFPEGVSRAGRG